MSLRSDHTNMDDLKKIISQKLGELKGLPPNLKRKKNSDIKEMIKYYNALTDKIEDRRIRIHSFSLQLLAVSIAALTLMITNGGEISVTYLGRFLFCPGLLVVVILVLASLFSTVLYEAQSWFRYPFLKLEEYGNKWKWFYYGNPEILKISSRPIFKTKDPKKTLIPYLNGLSSFLSNYKEEDLDNEITDNIQQLYLLQVHNYYKNRFYLQLTKIWQISFYIILIIVLLAIAGIIAGKPFI